MLEREFGGIQQPQQYVFECGGGRDVFGNETSHRNQFYRSWLSTESQNEQSFVSAPDIQRHHAVCGVRRICQ